MKCSRQTSQASARPDDCEAFIRSHLYKPEHGAWFFVTTNITGCRTGLLIHEPEIGRMR